MMNDFYTYAYLREDRTPYYVGKGKGLRVYSKQKNINLPTDKSRIIFLKQNLTEEEAFKHEIYMIAVFGRKDLGTGILRNRTDGGEGSSGLIHSEEYKAKMSKLYKGENNPNYGKSHSEETKRKQSEAMIGEHNPNYGKSFSEKTRKKLSEVMKGKYDGEKHHLYGKRRSEETKRKQSEAMIGEHHPNYGKTLLEETRRKMSESRKGKKWWNNGVVNKCSKECPGNEWVLGMKSRKS